MTENMKKANLIVGYMIMMDLPMSANLVFIIRRRFTVPQKAYEGGHKPTFLSGACCYRSELSLLSLIYDNSSEPINRRRSKSMYTWKVILQNS